MGCTVWGHGVGCCLMKQLARCDCCLSPERLLHSAPSLLGLAHVQIAEPAPGHHKEKTRPPSSAHLLFWGLLMFRLRSPHRGTTKRKPDLRVARSCSIVQSALQEEGRCPEGRLRQPR